MPRAATFTHPVQVRFTPDTVKRITAVAEAEGWTWTPSPSCDPLPSVSEGVRRLVVEALDARDTAPVETPSEHTVTLAPEVARWIDAEAVREGVDRATMARTLLREAATARAKR